MKLLSPRMGIVVGQHEVRVRVRITPPYPNPNPNPNPNPRTRARETGRPRRRPRGRLSIYLRLSINGGDYQRVAEAAQPKLSLEATESECSLSPRNVYKHRVLWMLT